MRPTRTEACTPWAIALAALLSQLGGCSAEEGQDTIRVGRCLEGYTCVPRSNAPPEPTPGPPAEDPGEPPPPEPTAPVPPDAKLRELDYRVVDAAYDAPTGEVVVVSDEPQELIVVAPDGLGERRYPLPDKPVTVGVSADGRLAGIGYATGVAVLEIATGAPVATCAAPTNVKHVAITNAGRVFALSSVEDADVHRLTALDSSTCSVLAEVGADSHSVFALTRSERTLFLLNGLFMRCLVQPASGTRGLESCDRTRVSDSCGGFWLERGETELYTQCATRYRLPSESDPAHPELRGGQFPDIDRVDMVTASAASNRVAVLGFMQVSGVAAPLGTRILRIYDSVFLDPLAALGLPPLPTATGTTASYGRFVFADAAMKTALVFVRAAPGSSARREFGLALVPIPEDTVAPDAGSLDSGSPDSASPEAGVR